MDKNSTLWCKSRIDFDGRNAWLHKIITPIGDIWVVQYENKGLEIQTPLMTYDEGKAWVKYERIVNGLMNGKL